MVVLKKNIIIIAFLFLSIGLGAQIRWGLEDCLKYAEINNLELKRQSLGIEMQENYLNQTRADRLPSLNANANQSVNFGKTVDLYTNDFAESRVMSMNLYMQSRMTVFSGLQLFNAVKREALQLEIMKYNLDYARDMKALQITTAFLDILYNTENLKNKKEQLKLSQLQLGRTQKLYDAGSIAESDLLNIKSQISSEEYQKVQAQNQLDMSYLNMKQMLNLPADTAFEIIIPEINMDNIALNLLPADLVYSTATENRPEIKSAEKNIEKSEKDLAIAKGAYSPTLSVSASVGTGYSGNNKTIDGDPEFNGFYPNGNFTSAGDTVFTPDISYNYKTKDYSTQFDENQNYSIGLNLSIPIFNKFQTKLNVENSKIAIEQAELDLEIEKDNLRKTIEQSYADAKAAINSYNSTKAHVEALEKSFNYALKKFDAGMISAFEFNDAKVKLNIAKSNLINAKFEYIFRIKVLEFYYGKALNF